MTDNTATHNEGLWFPDEAWATIASFLDNEDLARFRQLCSATQFVGSYALILQPHYNRLYAIDKTLPPLLPQEDTLAAFKQAFEKIQAKQQSEISYLTEHHPAIMAKREYVQVFQESATVSLQSLEAINAVLDKINSEIIKTKINFNNTTLILDEVGITRLPVTLLQEPAYAHFWQNLIHLSCQNNQLTSLNVQGLTALQSLLCPNNQLTSLNLQGLAALTGLVCNNNQLTTLDVQGLTALRWLDCHNNKLTTLNVQGLAALRDLDCDNNRLKTLILTGAHAFTKNKYAELERKLLFKKLSQTDSLEARQAIIRRLGADYTYKNCLKYCPVYAAKLSAFDSANNAYNLASSALSQAAAFLPSFGENPLKRKRDEDEVDREELSEEPDNQPPAKKRKRK